MGKIGLDLVGAGTELSFSARDFPTGRIVERNNGQPDDFGYEWNTNCRSNRVRIRLCTDTHLLLDAGSLDDKCADHRIGTSPGSLD